MIALDADKIAEEPVTSTNDLLHRVPKAIALERVEVVVDGAAAIYESNAIAGDLILRCNFDGLEASARAGVAEAGFTEHQIFGIFGSILGSRGLARRSAITSAESAPSSAPC